MKLVQLGIFETYRKAYEEAYRKALDAVAYLYEQGAERVLLFGSITKPGLFMSGSDIDIAVEGLPDERRFAVEGRLIDILAPYDFDLIVLDSTDVVTRKEITEAAVKEGICIAKS